MIFVILSCSFKFNCIVWLALSCSWYHRQEKERPVPDKSSSFHLGHKMKKKLGGYLNLIYNLEPNLAQYNPQSNPKPSCNMNNRKKIIIIETYKGVGVMFLQQKLTVKIIFLWYFCTIVFFTENDYLFLNIIAKYIFFTFLILKSSQVAFVYINIKIISWNILFHFFRLLLYHSIKICRFLYIWCALLIDGILNV